MDTVFVMLCLPDLDVAKAQIELFDPTVQTLKQLIGFKPGMAPESLLKNIVGKLPALESYLSDCLDGTD